MNSSPEKRGERFNQPHRERRGLKPGVRPRLEPEPPSRLIWTFKEIQLKTQTRKETNTRGASFCVTCCFCTKGKTRYFLAVTPEEMGPGCCGDYKKSPSPFCAAEMWLCLLAPFVFTGSHVFLWRRRKSKRATGASAIKLKHKEEFLLSWEQTWNYKPWKCFVLRPEIQEKYIEKQVSYPKAKQTTEADANQTSSLH